MTNSENISTPTVASAVAVYKAFWPPSPECRCEREKDTPFCCPPCTWARKSRQLQARIDASGLSIPVPVFDLAGDAPKIPSGNPLARGNPYFKALEFPDRVDERARKVAQSVARAGLPVFYLDLTRAIDFTLDGQGQAIDDIALYAPALVYCHNHDRRGDDISRMLPRLYSRASGFCWLIQQEGL